MRNTPRYENLQIVGRTIEIKKFKNHKSGNNEHWHEKIEILYFTRGTAVTYCSGTYYEVHAGDILFVNGNEFHIGILSYSDSEYCCIQINPDFFTNFISGNYITFQNRITDRECTNLLDKMIENYEMNDFRNVIELNKNLYSFLAILAERYVKSVTSEADFKKQMKKHDKLAAIISYINNYYHNTELSVNYLANIFSLSPSYLTHFFKEEYGKNISEYINETRIRNAKTLLETTDIPISEVAFKCGFLDANYFSRKFRQIAGVTPRKYRGH